jgi:hypothetical protein
VGLTQMTVSWPPRPSRLDRHSLDGFDVFDGTRVETIEHRRLIGIGRRVSRMRGWCIPRDPPEFIGVVYLSMIRRKLEQIWQTNMGALTVHQLK